MDRALCLGGPSGPMCSEIQSALYPLPSKPNIVSYVGGLGGREVSVEGFKSLITQGVQKAAQKAPGEFEMIGVRG